MEVFFDCSETELIEFFAQTSEFDLGQNLQLDLAQVCQTGEVVQLLSRILDLIIQDGPMQKKLHFLISQIGTN